VTPPSGVPHPGDYRVVGITGIGAATRLHAPFSSPSLSPRGSASGVFSNDDQRRWDRRLVSVLDLSSSS